MLEFYQTGGGRRFVDGTMVTIAESLKSIDSSLKEIVAHQSKMRCYADDERILCSTHKSDHEYMDRMEQLNNERKIKKNASDE
jgi:hypothetical protein